MRPTVRAVSKQFNGRVKLIVMDVNTRAGEQQAQQFRVNNHPALILQDRHGQIVLRMFGPVEPDRIQRGFSMLANAP